MPLVKGHYPTQAALDSILGNRNTTQADQPTFTNLQYLGITGLVDTAASLVTQVMTVVPIAVDNCEISKISVLVGATAASVPTNQWAALYAGTGASPVLLGQSTDGTTTAIGASARYDFTLATAQIVPAGIVFAAIMVKATTVPSLVTVDPGAVACQYAWFTTMAGASLSADPGSFSMSAGSSLTTTAPASLVPTGQKTAAPVVFLW